MLDTQTRWDRARRLILAATGDEGGDYDMIHDLGEGVSEPGYGDIADSLWATGDWNPKRFIFKNSGDQTPLTNAESLPSRLGDALAKYADIELLWHDEWYQCVDCQKAVRSTHDSYSWTAYFVHTSYGDLICGDCATWDDIEEDAVNDSRYLVPDFIDLEVEGFEQFNGNYENGWHPGQDDDPATLAQLAHDEDWDEVAFKVNSVGQFDIRFNMFVRKEQ